MIRQSDNSPSSVLLPLLSKRTLLKRFILTLIDSFYPPFRKLMPVQTFRYAACGAANTGLDILIYFISYNYILQKKILFIGFMAISPHIAAFLMAFTASFPLGYLLNRFIVFPDSVLRGRVQLFRYFLLVMICIVMNYFFIKLFVEQFGIYPTVSKMLTTVLVVSFSDLTQKHFTFKTQSSGLVK